MNSGFGLGNTKESEVAIRTQSQQNTQVILIVGLCVSLHLGQKMYEGIHGFFWLFLIIHQQDLCLLQADSFASDWGKKNTALGFLPSLAGKEVWHSWAV